MCLRVCVCEAGLLSVLGGYGFHTYSMAIYMYVCIYGIEQ